MTYWIPVPSLQCCPLSIMRLNSLYEYRVRFLTIGDSDASADILISLPSRTCSRLCIIRQLIKKVFVYDNLISTNIMLKYTFLHEEYDHKLFEKLTVLSMILAAQRKITTGSAAQHKIVSITNAGATIRLTLRKSNRIQNAIVIIPYPIFTIRSLTIEKCTKSNRNWLTSDEIILIFSLQLLMSCVISDGKFGDMMYVMLLDTS